MWKILFNEIDPTGQLLSFNNVTQLTSYLAGAINVDIKIADLASGALGQTTATTITLDDNAAEYKKDKRPFPDRSTGYSRVESGPVGCQRCAQTWCRWRSGTRSGRAAAHCGGIPGEARRLG